MLEMCHIELTAHFRYIWTVGNVGNWIYIFDVVEEGEKEEKDDDDDDDEAWQFVHFDFVMSKILFASCKCRNRK